MCILGGLEFVAAGYVLNELHKDSKKEQQIAKDRKRRRESHSRPHRKESSHRPHQPSYALQPPQNGPVRPYSAPPPQHRPTWPQSSGQQSFGPPPYLQHAATMPPPQRPNNRPPPGAHVDLKTGKVQYNMWPADMQPQTPRRSPNVRAVTPHVPNSPAPSYNQLQSNQSQVRINAVPVPSPRPGYAELDAETPGRYRPLDVKDSRMLYGAYSMVHSPTPPPPYRIEQY